MIQTDIITINEVEYKFTYSDGNLYITNNIGTIVESAIELLDATNVWTETELEIPLKIKIDDEIKSEYESLKIATKVKNNGII